MPPARIFRRLLFVVSILLPGILLGGCGEVPYYAQCIRGHLGIMTKTRSIQSLLTDPSTPSDLHHKLEKVTGIRDFAGTEMLLPDNGSYRSYADIGRRYVVWNVIAAEEFSLTPKQWCFPVAGCVGYKGFFQRSGAEKLARSLREQGYDVDLYGVEAYSTLNWFSDPVLNTFIASTDARLAGLIFHELAHQLIYVRDDTAFNEGFAMTVQLEGVRRWFDRQGTEEQWRHYRKQRNREKRFHAFLGDVREQLAQLYRRSLPAARMRAEKQRLLAAAQSRFEELKTTEQLGYGFDRWMARGLNNARLAGIATYQDLIPAFQALLRQSAGDLDRFYREVQQLARLPQKTRMERLTRLLPPDAAATLRLEAVARASDADAGKVSPAASGDDE